MRSFASMLICGMASVRSVHVGPVAGVPTFKDVPGFETRRRKRLVRQTAYATGGNDHKGAVDLSYLNESEARRCCYENYGFLQKPLLLNSWCEFLVELRRIEFRWKLLPLLEGIINFSIVEYTREGETVLCDLRTLTRSGPIANFFECCGALVQGSTDKYFVGFSGPDGVENVLEVRTNRLICGEQDTQTADEKPIVPTLAQFNCRGTSVDLILTNSETGAQRTLIRNFSLQSFNYAFLTSIPIFLKQTDIGIRNVDFVSEDQMRHFRFAWCFLRRESMMTPVEMSELDYLLPLK
uniref:WGS project CAEQ00000000 data, annotated contig 1249 n=1 Tax=Trypanosoma congolense (strain IL3000) TaxID=1068625 RepID=F9W4Y1_TRYCI|nr:unnamed protein product [Trypanosoma congolense IL3000]